MTFPRRLAIIATAIASLAFAAPTFAQGVTPAATTIAKTDVAITAFATAFLNNNDDGMLAALPVLVAAAEAEGDAAIASTLTTFLDVLAERDDRSWEALIEQFAAFADIGIISRVYDELNRLAVALPLPTLDDETPRTDFEAGIFAARSRSESPNVGPLQVTWDFGLLWQDSIAAVATIPGLPQGPSYDCLIQLVPTGDGTIDISVSMFRAQPARVSLVLIDESGSIMDFPPLALTPEIGFRSIAEVGDRNWLAALGEADALLFVETTQQGTTMRMLVRKGETGRAIFDQAFAAWGLTPEGAE